MGYQEQERKRVEALHWRHGMVPAWTRVWSNAVDVTAEPPSTWPVPRASYLAGKHGPAERDYRLQQHAAAVAERGELSSW